MTKQIDILVVEPGQAPRVTQAENTLEAFETIIGAPTDVGCYLPQRVMLVCRENAKHDRYIAGKFLLCGLGEDGFDSLPPSSQNFRRNFLCGEVGKFNVEPFASLSFCTTLEDKAIK